MNEPKKAYSYGHLITIATIADEIAIARGTVGHDELRDLAKRFASGELKTPPLFPPHQLWQHGGDASRIGAATPDPDGVWRILFKKTSKPHQSDKDAFNHPPSAYTWHMLAADVYELGQQPVWKTQTAAALRNLACRYNSDLLDEMPEPAAQQPKPAAVEALPVQPKAAAPAPVADESESNAPLQKAKAKRRTWKDVSASYIVEVMRAGRYTTAKELYRALESKAGANSPFDKGTGDNRGSLFVRDIAESLSLKTVQNNWQSLREQAKK